MKAGLPSARFFFGLVATIIVAGNGDHARAQLTYYTSSSVFTTANPGLPTEGFESARVNPGAFALIPSPINSTTNDGVFLPGDLLTGFSLSSVGSGGTGLVALGTGTTPGGTKEVGVQAFSNAMEITLSPNDTALGANLITSTGPGVVGSGTFNISVFGTSGMLGSTSVNVSGINTFFGVSSASGPITKIDISEQGSNSSVFLDQLKFGTPASSPFTLYSNRTTFTSANPGLSIETFESARVNPGSFAVIPSPINSTTNDGVFRPGDLLKGFSLSSVGSGGTNLVALGTGTTPGATKEVGVVTFANTMALTFDAAQTAVGLDLITSTGPGVAGDGTFDISIFGAGGLITTTSVNVTGIDTFFGVQDLSGITEIDITDHAANSSVLVDNLTFTSLAQAVPEPSVLVLSCLGAVVVLGVSYARRRTGSIAASV